MNPILKNILAVLAGLIIGSIVNGGIIAISNSIIPLPDGADTSTMEGLKAAVHLLEPKHFIMSFLAHALGTFVGAFIAAKLAANHKIKFALSIGIFFLLGGTYVISQAPFPTWIVVLDLGLAYIPMGYLAGKLATK